MESKWKKTFARVRLHSMRFGNIRVVISLGFVLWICVSHFGRTQAPDMAKPSTNTVSRDKWFGTPQATIKQLILAVNRHRWRDEYECYTGPQQARFTYHVMVCTRELSDSPDLSAELERVLQRSQFPLAVLERFPSQRSDLSNLSDPDEVQLAIQGQLHKLQLQRDLWEREVQSLNIDWAQLIAELQPLFIENYRRHENRDHPSQNGIVHHLDFHMFDRVSNIKIDGNRAQALIFASVRDPAITTLEDTPSQHGNGISSVLDWSFRKLKIRDSRVKRDPEEIRLVRQTGDWKIESVPFR